MQCQVRWIEIGHNVNGELKISPGNRRPLRDGDILEPHADCLNIGRAFLNKLEITAADVNRPTRTLLSVVRRLDNITGEGQRWLAKVDQNREVTQIRGSADLGVVDGDLLAVTPISVVPISSTGGQLIEVNIEFIVTRRNAGVFVACGIGKICIPVSIIVRAVEGHRGCARADCGVHVFSGVG